MKTKAYIPQSIRSLYVFDENLIGRTSSLFAALRQVGKTMLARNGAEFVMFLEMIADSS